MPATERKPFWQRLLRVQRLAEPEVDHDPVPSNARERAKRLFDRLTEEQLERKSDTFSFPDNQGRIWDVEHSTRFIGTEEVSFFNLRREVSSTPRWLLFEENPAVNKETFTIFPWFVGHMDLTSPHYKYMQLNSEKTLTAAESTMAPLFPVSEEAGAVLPPVSVAPTVTNG